MRVVPEYYHRSGSPQTRVHRGWLYVAGAGLAVCLGSAIVAAVGAHVAYPARMMADVGVPAAHGLAACSFLARARSATGRVRLRLLLLGVSMVAAGVHEIVLGRLAALSTSSMGTLYPAIELLAVAGLAIALGMAVAGLVVAAGDGGAVLLGVRRLLDGWMIAGSLFTLGWVLMLQRADLNGDVWGALSDIGRVVTDILVLGLLVALRFAVRRQERAAVTLAAAGLVLLAVSDMLRVFWAWPAASPEAPFAEACSIAGMLVVAATPWMPGGGSILGAERRVLPVAGVVAAFLPVLVCAVAVVAHTVASGELDLVLVVVGGSVLLALSVRQGVTQADNLCVTREVAAREDHFRKLVQGSNDVITVTGHDWVLRYVSPAVHRVFGYRPEDLVGIRLPQLVHPDDLTPLRNAIGGLRETAEDGRHGIHGHHGHHGIHGLNRRISCRIRSADGRWCHTESTVSRHTDGLILNTRDVTEQVALRAQLEHLAFHDALTGLPNRVLFADRLGHALARRSAGSEPPTVLFLDLDGFKAVNDSSGHAVGDELLVQVARRLRGAVRAGDTVARLGGDEFGALLEGPAGACETRTREVAERLLSAVSHPYRIGDVEARVAASIGIAVASSQTTAEELMRNADMAMYGAKAAGKGRIEMYRQQAHRDERPGRPCCRR